MSVTVNKFVGLFGKEATNEERMEAIKPVLNDITTKIVEKFDPLKIILFGSFARGNPHKWSDLDIMVVFENVDNCFDKAAEILGHIENIQFSTDIVVVGKDVFIENINETGYIYYYANKYGRVLHER